MILNPIFFAVYYIVYVCVNKYIRRRECIEGSKEKSARNLPAVKCENIMYARYIITRTIYRQLNVKSVKIFEKFGELVNFLCGSIEKFCGLISTGTLFNLF